MKNILKNDTYVLSVSYGDYLTSTAGTDKVIKEQQIFYAEKGISFIHIFPFKWQLHRITICNIWGVRLDETLQLCSYQTLYKLIKQLFLSDYKLCAVFIHHIMKVNLLELEKLLDLCDKEIPIYWYIHDYFLVCEQYNLLRNDSTFCGYMEEKIACKTCSYFQKKQERDSYIKRLLKKYKQSSVFLTPSSTASVVVEKRLGNFFPIKVMPHQELKGENKIFSGNHLKLRIAYVGYQARNKGYEQWKEFVTYHKDQFEFYHMGSAIERLPGVCYIEVSFQKEGTMAMTDALKKNKIDMVFLWSLWAETYSYTYFESMAANCFVITYQDSGNIAEQVKKNGNGFVYKSLQELKEDKETLLQRYQEWLSQKRAGPSLLLANQEWSELLYKKEYSSKDEQEARPKKKLRGERNIFIKVLFYFYKQRHKKGK